MCSKERVREREFAKPSGVLTEGNVYALENSREFMLNTKRCFCYIYRNELHHVGNSTSLLLVARYKISWKPPIKPFSLAGKHTDTDAAISKQHKPPQ